MLFSVFRKKYAKGLNSAKSVVLIVTSNTFSSFWVPTEIGLSIGGTFTSVIPVLYGVTIDIVAQKFPWILTLKYITCTDENKANAFEEIFSLIKKINQRNDSLRPLDIEHIAKRFYRFNTPMEYVLLRRGFPKYERRKKPDKLSAGFPSPASFH